MKKGYSSDNGKGKRELRGVGTLKRGVIFNFYNIFKK